MNLAHQVLSGTQFTRDVIQDFVPLAQSLEWELGQQYLRERGNKAFISDASPVPFVVNNDGTLSKNAAEVFFASLLAADQAGTLEDDIYVLELGIGVGLFARFFLDHLQELSHKHHKDYYYRLCYVAADKSERMLTDVLKHGVLNNHPGRVRVRPVDAMESAHLPEPVRTSLGQLRPSALSRLNFGVVETHGPLGPRLSLRITKPWAERPTSEFSITCNPKI